MADPASRYTLWFRTVATALVTSLVAFLSHRGVNLTTDQTVWATSGIFVVISGLWNLAESKGWLKWLKYFNLSVQKSDAGAIVTPRTATATPQENA